MNTSQGQRGSFLLGEWRLLVSLATSALFFVYGPSWLADLSNMAWLAFLFAWLFAVILLSATAVVRHAESLAAKLGEPLGTLILTLSVTGIEVMMISSVMFAGKGHPALARDTVFGAVMIALNGMVGLSLLLGGAALPRAGIQSAGSERLPGRPRAAAGARSSSAELHGFHRWPDILAPASHLPYRHVDRAVWCVSRDTERATPGVLPGPDFRRDGGASKRP